ncbi:hypothetical protein [Desulfofustis limnaeus]|uniref:Sulfotransferase family protein n=1 Tax=Desulfofustis limnaeus TaxID=2740163 RepID=A0ABM7WAF6_9BACT|nr:hypothetical protein [Desulfofustis limnaeus]BDD87891.1 hypothetical protein DPPLL_22560 [Desulfofustis limnaeus]
MLIDKLYRFAIDRINGRFVRGWCFYRLAKRRPVLLRLVADDTEIGSVLCRDYRPDLQRSGLHPTGCCGFDCSFPDGFDPLQYRRLSIQVDGHSRPLLSFACRDLELLRPSLTRPIFFMHLPKTAGSSFNAFARRCFSASCLAFHVERLPPEERGRLAGSAQFLSGHLPWRQALGMLPPQRWQYLALLREPRAHLHSHLNYVRRVAADERLEVHYDFHHNRTIKELSRWLGAIDLTDDDQLRDFVTGLSGYQRDFFDNMQTRYFLDYRPERVTQSDLEQAVATMQRFHQIGLTESYDRFRDRFCRDLGLPPQPQSVQANRAQHYRLFDPARTVTWEILDPLIRFDLQLYEYAASHLAADDAEAPAGTKNKTVTTSATTQRSGESAVS